MSVAQHLNIKLSEYDQRIRTFIPHYEEMLRVAAEIVGLIGKRAPTIIDLGIGTGALAARCLKVAPQARIYGIDADADILHLARRRLSRQPGNALNLIHGSFLEASFIRCDAMVATLALHHIGAAKDKQAFYGKCFRALRRGGIFVNGDCFLSGHSALSEFYREIWQIHLRRFYSSRQASNFFAAWAKEDTYFSLQQEVAMLTGAGFEVEVVWRRPPFAVLMGLRGPVMPQ